MMDSYSLEVSLDGRFARLSEGLISGERIAESLGSRGATMLDEEVILIDIFLLW